MTKKETQELRVERVKAFLKTRPGVPLHFGDIWHATGVHKSQVDYKSMLSADPEVERTKAMFHPSGKMRTFWAYTGNERNLREIKVQDVDFSEWKAWTKNRNDLVQKTEDVHGGIYMFAHFTDGVPPAERATVEDVPKEVVYIGMSKNLNNRPLDKHSCIARYRENFDDSDLDHLDVCILPVYAVKDPDRMLFYHRIRLLEVEVQFRYLDIYRKLPALHYKEHRDKKK